MTTTRNEYPMDWQKDPSRPGPDAESRWMRRANELADQRNDLVRALELALLYIADPVTKPSELRQLWAIASEALERTGNVRITRWLNETKSGYLKKVLDGTLVD